MRRLVVLAAVLLVLVAVWLLQRWQQRAVVASAPVATLTLDPDKVTKLRIEKPGGEKVEIGRVAGAWRIEVPGDYRASEPVVSGVLKTLQSLALSDVVSTNPAKRGIYQVDSTGTRVQVLEGESTVLDVVVGKSSPDFAHTYVRRHDQDPVYRADGMLAYNFNKRVDDWRDKTILDVPMEGVSRLNLEYPQEKVQLTLARADSAWTLAAGGGAAEEADSTAAEQLLRVACKLSTNNFATPEEAAGLDFGTPVFRVRIDSDTGSQAVAFVEGQEGKMFAQRDGDTTVFQLFKTSLTNLMKKPDDLRPKGA